jgi:hypothetical protein
MSATLRIDDTATAELRAIAAQLANPTALYKDVGRRGANDLKKHFRQREADNPNKLSGNRTHFWLDVRDGVQQPALVAGGVDLIVQHPAIAAKVYGAHVVAKNAAALTISLHALAHGRRASVFEEETGYDLFHPKGTQVLMAEISGEAVPIYWLTKSVDIPADPKALPETGVFVEGLLATANAHLARMLARASQS